MKLKIGTRDSKLALIQTQMLVDSILENNKDIEIEIVAMKTTGDKILNVTLDKIGGKGLFVKELDDALLSHEVDITVHSFKDMPTEIREDLPIVAVSKRADPRDVLICRKDSKNEVIGSSSQRRAKQLEKLGYKTIVPMRGNLTTRLAKLDNGDCDAIVLAAAGVKRSGLEDRINKYFSVQEIIPAACQGIIAVQGRKGEDFSYLKNFHDEETAIVAKAERAFITELNGGCSSPIASYAILENENVTLTGMYVNDKNETFIKTGTDKKENAHELGIKLAKEILREAE